MTHVGNDSFAGELVPGDIGPIVVEVVAEIDKIAEWTRDASAALLTGTLHRRDMEVGGCLLAEAAGDLERSGRPELARASLALRTLADALGKDGDASGLAALSEWSTALSWRGVDDEAAARFRFRVAVTPEKAAFSSWYELFPRSASPDPRRPGRLSDVVDRLGYLGELGFDVLYLPPIHPIGTTARKGKGNTSPAGAHDVGSPWAIGGPAGGHEALAPELGTLADFERLVTEAERAKIDIAMDLAFQCSPDHPWVTEHPEWFRHRPDGTIACAENPPKSYEDIYPLDFHTADRVGLWLGLRHVVSTWAERGVRIFRVDNPHTKPFAFWEWLIADVKSAHPGTIFLAEAFTRPKVMHRLAKLGFDQSYTYFTWRNDKRELVEYFEELTAGPGRSYFWPNVWANTPDILARSLQHADRASFIARLVLAGGLSASYGIYGPVFELMWNEPAAPGSEEYLHSEKYEVHYHDLDDPRSLRHVISALNAARHAHRALQRDANLRFLPVDNDRIVAWEKHDDTCSDLVIGVVNLDPNWVQSGFVELDLGDYGVEKNTSVSVRDVLADESYFWQSGRNFVRLDPAGVPAHLLVADLARARTGEPGPA